MGQGDEQGTVAPDERRAFPLALQDDELLTQQGVFHHQFRFAAGKIPGQAYRQGIVTAVGACPLAQALLGPAAQSLYPALDGTKEGECHGLPFEQV